MLGFLGFIGSSALSLVKCFKTSVTLREIPQCENLVGT